MSEDTLSSRRTWIVGVGGMLVGLAWPRWAAAHPRHATMARAEFNREQGKLQVALQTDPDDLERALQATGTDLQPEDAAAQAHVERYIREHIIVRPPAKKSDEPRPMTWVGMEVFIASAWLYFEYDVQGIWGLRITNTVYFDVQGGQVNTMNLVDGARRTTVITTSHEPTGIVGQPIRDHHHPDHH